MAVTATHALLSMASPMVPATLDALAGNDDDRARALAGHWLALSVERQSVSRQGYGS